MLCVLGAVAVSASAQPSVSSNDLIVEARAAWARKDGVALTLMRDEAIKGQHPLALWVDYWELQQRLSTATTMDVEAFTSRWPHTYVEDRLRNDWLLELGRRRDFGGFARELPRFRMQDDREVDCWALLMQFTQGVDVTAQARQTWMDQREADEGCQALATDLYAARQFTVTDAWRKARQATEAGRQRVARHAVGLINEDAANRLGDIFQNPARYLAKRAGTGSKIEAELTALALVRLAATDVDMSASLHKERWAKALPSATSAWVWSAVAKQAAMKLLPQADDYFQLADTAYRGRVASEELSDDTLAWKARAALRANHGAGRWQQVMQAINAMSQAQQEESTWVYWKARALNALAADSQNSDALRAQAVELFTRVSGEVSFYGLLAAEELGRPFSLPPRPQVLSTTDRSRAAGQAGLWRALELIHAGLRAEGVREWNYTVGWGKPGGWDDRELRAIAQLACDHEVWDRCINTSDKTRSDIDVAQRFPLPFRADVTRAAQAAGLDPAYVYGLIRQESRFLTEARSGVGAAGLMQVMPTTARWTAKRLGMPFSASQLVDRDTNLKIGTAYLKLLLDDFGGSAPMATAGYNAGPSRPRRWREGPPMDPAAWAENIPFSETRDYVKKVLSNATVYAAVMSNQPQSLKTRLGALIGPPPPTAPAADLSLP